MPSLWPDRFLFLHNRDLSIRSLLLLPQSKGEGRNFQSLKDYSVWKTRSTLDRAVRRNIEISLSACTGKLPTQTHSTSFSLSQTEKCTNALSHLEQMNSSSDTCLYTKHEGFCRFILVNILLLENLRSWGKMQVAAFSCTCCFLIPDKNTAQKNWNTFCWQSKKCEKCCLHCCFLACGHT